MISRKYIRCETCGHNHILRIQVGNDPYQEHTFYCYECEEEITVGMHCFRLSAATELQCIQNCTPIDVSDGTVINLSPDFPIAKDQLHQIDFFPALDFMENIAKRLDESNVEPESIGFSSVEEFQEWAQKHQSLNERWAIIKKGWSLHSKERFDLAEKCLSQYRAEGYDDGPELKFVLHDFSRRMLQPFMGHLFDDIFSFLKTSFNKNKAEYARFHSYYVSNIKDENLDRYYEVFKEYFSCNDFLQTLMYQQYEIPIPASTDASSYNFSKTKLFYGNAFEAITSNVTVIACLNNISCGRRFDQFDSMDLKKYLTINKANRCNPFKDVPELKNLVGCIDSTIRNSSHHGGMRLVGRGEEIEYRSGGDGALRKMKYIEYIERCNTIMLNCCALLALEIFIVSR